MKSKRPQMSWLQTNTVRIARLHFLLVIAYAVFVILYDAWKLVTPEILQERWTITVAMLVITTAVWFVARNTALKNTVYRLLLMILISMDLLFAGYAVYAGRGMASRGVALFALPIIISAVALSRSALFATATVSAGIYSYAAIKYFTDHPSEGYKVELYGDLFFYGASLFLLAAVLWAIVSSVRPKSP